MMFMFTHYKLAYYKLSPLVPYYGLYSIDVENFFSSNHTDPA